MYVGLEFTSKTVSSFVGHPNTLRVYPVCHTKHAHSCDISICTNKYRQLRDRGSRRNQTFLQALRDTLLARIFVSTVTTVDR